MELKDLVAIVTGAGRGIGKATAKKLSEEGASVVLRSRNPDQQYPEVWFNDFRNSSS